MKNIVWVIWCLIWTIPLLAGEPTDKTIEGELLDLRCYTSRESKGPDHKTCAARCLSSGAPAAVLAANGMVITLAAASKSYSPFAAEQVRITGKMNNGAILPETMQVKQEGTWIEVPLKFGAPDNGSTQSMHDQ